MLPPPGSLKEARFQRVAAAVIELVGERGAEGLQYAEVAGRAGVSRAWLYKYFGRDRDTLVAFAARTLGDAFIEHDQDRSGLASHEWRDVIASATRQGLEDAVQAPILVVLWFRYRHADGVAGEAVRDVVRRHVEKFVDDMPSELRRDRARARRFAEVFASARMGAFHLWLDPAFRAVCSIEEVVGPLLGMLDAYSAPAGPTAGG